MANAVLQTGMAEYVLPIPGIFKPGRHHRIPSGEIERCPGLQCGTLGQPGHQPRSTRNGMDTGQSGMAPSENVSPSSQRVGERILEGRAGLAEFFGAHPAALLDPSDLLQEASSIAAAIEQASNRLTPDVI